MARMNYDDLSRRGGQLTAMIDQALGEKPPNQTEAANLRKELTQVQAQIKECQEKLNAAVAETARLKAELAKLQGGGTLRTNPQ
jgi:predicted nuclease with TOPRIM domain